MGWRHQTIRVLSKREEKLALECGKAQAENEFKDDRIRLLRAALDKIVMLDGYEGDAGKIAFAALAKDDR